MIPISLSLTLEPGHHDEAVVGFLLSPHLRWFLKGPFIICFRQDDDGSGSQDRRRIPWKTGADLPQVRERLYAL
jgi:hypothetical protein